MSLSTPGKKTAQARISELERRIKVEEALERVRSRTMAMHRSDELAETAVILFKQLEASGITPDRAWITIIDEQTDTCVMWMTRQGGEKLLQGIPIPLVGHPLAAEIYDAWKRQEPLLQDLSGEALAEWLGWIQKESEVSYREIPERWVYYWANFTQGYVAIAQQMPIPEETQHILQCFARVFEQTYTRFLDLQKAEAQAREAQIEAALEQVRARSMAMYDSSELSEVAALLFKQLRELGAELWSCGFAICRENEILVEKWMGSPVEGHMLKPLFIPYNADYGEQSMYDTWKNRVDLHAYVQEGEDLRKIYEHLMTVPSFIENFAEVIKSGKPLPVWQKNHIASYKYGYLLIITTQPFEDAHIFPRFAKVFEQTYTRFLDLQKAEEQAREAVRQASVDRVRAEIASMRTADDLKRITPLIWRELTTLGVPFFRCGVFIVDEDTRTTHTYLSTPDGTSLAVLHLPFDSSPLVEETVAHWRRKQVYTEQWDRAQFAAWVAALVEQGLLDAVESYQGGDEPPERLALHFLPFTQGMLYVGSAAPLADDQIDLVQALADAFSVAYARYEDFQKIEATLADLRATQAQLIQQEKLASLGQLTAGIAHEIKNPLNFVNNFSQLSMEVIEEVATWIKRTGERGDGEIEELIDTLRLNESKIHEHGRRADRIVQSMMQHASGGKGDRQAVDLNAFVEEYVNLALHSWRAETRRVSGKTMTPSSNATDTAGLIVTRNYDEAAGAVELVPQEIGQVLVNLFNNAFDAVRERGERSEERGEVFRGEIVISTSRNENAVEIQIADNGPGISQDVRDKIFEPFFTTKPAGSGTGLGLSLSYDIVTQGHGGKLEMQSQKGKGATFIVWLPVEKG